MNNIPLISQQLTQVEFPSPEKAVLVYFSAHWCGPCRQFTPMLKVFYEFARSSGAALEIIFVSSDRTQPDMINYYKQSHGDWLAVIYGSTQRNFLSTHFNVKGIPALFLLNRGTLHAVEEDVRSVIQQVAIMRNVSRVKEIVEGWRERSGALLFERIPSSISALNSAQDRESALELLTRIMGNICDHPTESKYRFLRADNAVLCKTLLDRPCGDLPLTAIAFHKNGDSYEYRQIGADASTLHKILSNRHVNGLVSAAVVSAPVGRLKIMHRLNDPITTEPLLIESMEIFSAVVESVTDIVGSYQRMFLPTFAAADDTLLSRLNVSFARGECVDVLVLGQQTNTSPSALEFTTDEFANKCASALREQVAELSSTANVALLGPIFNAAIHSQIYEVPLHQKKALECVPVWDLHARVTGGGGGSYSELIFKELLNWFKSDFFKWVDKPRCGHCQSVSTMLVNGSSPPTLQESKGLANTVEVYSCEICGGMTRFPRFNHPVALLSTRAGRCGEWTNCFALIARSLGFEIRRVFDSADHVWLEVWMEHLREWIHCDPCENAYNKPSLYEIGWGKTPTFTFACSKDGVRDVSSRYTSSSAISTTTPKSQIIQSLNEILQKNWAKSDEILMKKLIERDEEETIGWALSSHAVGGRTSGDPSWVAARGEAGQPAPCVFIGDDNDEIEIAPICGDNSVCPNDAVPFSDEHAIRQKTSQRNIPKIESILVWMVENRLVGIQVQPFGDSHCCSQMEGSTEHVFALKPDEYIAQVKIQSNAAGVSGIGFETNLSNSFIAGELDTNETQNTISEGMRLVGFHGCMGTCIYTIGVITGPVNIDRRVSNEFYQ